MSTGDFRVADISLADFGRKEIELAEHEVRHSSDTVLTWIALTAVSNCP
jgi:S-adenosylhomocysteine hydrolase